MFNFQMNKIEKIERESRQYGVIARLETELAIANIKARRLGGEYIAERDSISAQLELAEKEYNTSNHNLASTAR